MLISVKICELKDNQTETTVPATIGVNQITELGMLSEKSIEQDKAY